MWDVWERILYKHNQKCDLTMFTHSKSNTNYLSNWWPPYPKTGLIIYSVDCSVLYLIQNVQNRPICLAVHTWRKGKILDNNFQSIYHSHITWLRGGEGWVSQMITLAHRGEGEEFWDGPFSTAQVTSPGCTQTRNFPISSKVRQVWSALKYDRFVQSSKVIHLPQSTGDRHSQFYDKILHQCRILLVCSPL